MVRHKDPISHENLREAILSVFIAVSRNTFTDLSVGFLNSISHLEGVVDARSRCDTAEELAKHGCGVCGVVILIEAPGAPSPLRPAN